MATPVASANRAKPLRHLTGGRLGELLNCIARAVTGNGKFRRDQQVHAFFRCFANGPFDAGEVGFRIARHGSHLEGRDPHAHGSDDMAPSSRLISPNFAIRPKMTAAIATNKIDTDAMVGV